MNRSTAAKPIRVLAVLTGLLIASLAVYEVRWLCYVPDDEPLLMTLAFWSFAGCIGAFGLLIGYVCVEFGIRGE